MQERRENTQRLQRRLTKTNEAINRLPQYPVWEVLWQKRTSGLPLEQLLSVATNEDTKVEINSKTSLVKEAIQGKTIPALERISQSIQGDIQREEKTESLNAAMQNIVEQARKEDIPEVIFRAALAQYEAETGSPYPDIPEGLYGSAPASEPTQIVSQPAEAEEKPKEKADEPKRQRRTRKKTEEEQKPALPHLVLDSEAQTVKDGGEERRLSAFAWEMLAELAGKEEGVSRSAISDIANELGVTPGLSSDIIRRSVQEIRELFPQHPDMLKIERAGSEFIYKLNAEVEIINVEEADVSSEQAAPSEKKEMAIVLPDRIAALRLIAEKRDASLDEVINLLEPDRRGRKLTPQRADFALNKAVNVLFARQNAKILTPDEQALWDKLVEVFTDPETGRFKDNLRARIAEWKKGPDGQAGAAVPNEPEPQEPPTGSVAEKTEIEPESAAEPEEKKEFPSLHETRIDAMNLFLDNPNIDRETIINVLGPSRNDRRLTPSQAKFALDRSANFVYIRAEKNILTEQEAQIWTRAQEFAGTTDSRATWEYLKQSVETWFRSDKKTTPAEVKSVEEKQEKQVEILDRTEAAMLASLLLRRNRVTVLNNAGNELFIFNLPKEYEALCNEIIKSNPNTSRRVPQNEVVLAKRNKMIDTVARIIGDERLDDLEKQDPKVAELLMWMWVQDQDEWRGHLKDFLSQEPALLGKTFRGAVQDIRRVVRLSNGGGTAEQIQTPVSDLSLEEARNHPLFANPYYAVPEGDRAKPKTADAAEASSHVPAEKADNKTGQPDNKSTEETVLPEAVEISVADHESVEEEQTAVEKANVTAPTEQIADEDAELEEIRRQLEELERQEREQAEAEAQGEPETTTTEPEKQESIVRRVIGKIIPETPKSPWSEFERRDKEIKQHIEGIAGEVVNSMLGVTSTGAFVVREFNSLTRSTIERAIERGIINPAHNGEQPTLTRSEVAIMLYDSRFGRNKFRSRDYSKIVRLIDEEIAKQIEAKKEEQKQSTNGNGTNGNGHSSSK